MGSICPGGGEKIVVKRDLGEGAALSELRTDLKHS